MKKTIALLIAVIMILGLCACAAAKIEASEARAWTKDDWAKADDKLRKKALEVIITADREDIDAEKSAEVSLDGFNEYFITLEDETITLGEIYDLCTVEEVEQ